MLRTLGNSLGVNVLATGSQTLRAREATGEQRAFPTRALSCRDDPDMSHKTSFTEGLGTALGGGVYGPLRVIFFAKGLWPPLFRSRVRMTDCR